MFSKNKIFYSLAVMLASTAVLDSTVARADQNSSRFNPDISLILDGRYGGYSNNSSYALPGFMLGGEASRGEKGFYLGHNELMISANIDDMFYGKLTTAITDHNSTTEVELEEAYIETIGLGNGLNVKAGRFFSDIGYLNNKHGHTWDFVDAPLVYRGLFGNQIKDDGIQFSWVAPTDLYLKLGAEATRGARYPSAGANNGGAGAKSLFVKLGGDIGVSQSWQAGLSHWESDVSGREAATHSHAGSTVTETPTFYGTSKVNGVDFIWRWSPQGNASNKYVKIQAEYFERTEAGKVDMVGSSPFETTTYNGKQQGWYLQTVYKFMPRWRIGLRYDELDSTNTGSDSDILTEAGLTTNGHTPRRSTVMLDYSRSEFSRIRLQISQDNSYSESDTLVFLQYTVSLGSHGAHQF